MSNVIKLNGKIKPNALIVAMRYRGVSKNKLCENINELSNNDLNKFLKGYYACISENKLKEIMIFLDFPFEFLYKDFKPIKTSLDL